VSKSQLGINKKLSLETLALDLAINMVDLATNDNNEFKGAAKIFLEEEAIQGKVNRRVRNVLIVGAGASTNANKNIRSAITIMDALDKEFVTSPDQKMWVEHIRTKAEERSPGIDPQSFEFRLKFLQEVLWDKDLGQEFRTRLGFRHVPSLFYEIVGHMFKHRLIDVIINFNFDEILDTVIAEEMGEGEYSRIVMNGDCPDNLNDLYLGKKLRGPVYIKPHGSVSHAGTIKFTYDHYSDGNAAVKLLLSDLFSDVHEIPSTSLEMNVISAGYSYSDPDLHKLLKKASENKKKIINYYVFDWKERKDYFERPAFWQLIGAKPFYKETSQEDLGAVFDLLWTKVTNCFKDQFRDRFPKGIERHKIIAGLFQDPGAKPLRYFNSIAISKSSKGVDPHLPNPNAKEEALENSARYIRYVRHRIFVEIAIVLLKSQGLIHVNQFRNSRLKRYFSLLHELHPEGKDDQSLDSFLKCFGFVEPYLKVMRDTYQISRTKLDPATSKIRIPELLKKLSELIEKDELVTGEYLSWFEKISTNTLCIVNSDLREFYLSPFKSVTKNSLLYNDMKWLYETKKVFDSKSWNTVLVISERGDVMLDKSYQNRMTERNAIVWAILADHREDRTNDDPSHKQPEDFKKMRTRIEYLPWETHNKHMYVFLKIPKRGDQEIKYVSGIYYVRRLLTDVVNPIMLKDEDDVKILFDYFCSYWQKAQSYTECGYDRLNLTDEYFKKVQGEIQEKLKEDAQGDKPLERWILPDLLNCKKANARV
jgi:hypothetical protein